MNNPWTEKYRPKKLDDIIGQDEIINDLKAILEHILVGDLKDGVPNMIFFGAPSTGKTTAALAFVREAFGDKYFGINWKEMNASDERGIDVVRNEIKKFARASPTDTYMGSDGVERPCPFKVMFLDEVDGLTEDAQFALRRTMEKPEYMKNTIFILAANFPHKVIEPLQSRAMFFDKRFKRLKTEDIVAILKKVVQSENLNINDANIRRIAESSNGDSRCAMNKLWVASLKDGEIEIKDEASELAKKVELDLTKALLKGEREVIRDLVTRLYYDYGYSGEQIIYSIYEHIDVIPREVSKVLLPRLVDGMHYCALAMDDYIMSKAFLESLTCQGKQ